MGIGTLEIGALRRRGEKSISHPAGTSIESNGCWIINEAQNDEEAVAEDEEAFESTTSTVMEVPLELVPAVRELIAKSKLGQPRDDLRFYSFGVRSPLILENPQLHFEFSRC